jgi:hypothetical protein
MDFIRVMGYYGLNISKQCFAQALISYDRFNEITFQFLLAGESAVVVRTNFVRGLRNRTVGGLQQAGSNLCACACACASRHQCVTTRTHDSDTRCKFRTRTGGHRDQCHAELATVESGTSRMETAEPSRPRQF